MVAARRFAGDTLLPSSRFIERRGLGPTSHGLSAYQVRAPQNLVGQQLIFCRFTNDANAQANEPGGTFTLGTSPRPFQPLPRGLSSSACAGSVNQSLFTGNIDFQPLLLTEGQPSFWLQRLTCASVAIAEFIHIFLIAVAHQR